MIQLSFFLTSVVVGIIIPKFKILFNNRFELIMVKNKKNVNSVGKVVLLSLQNRKIMCRSLKRFVNFVGE